MLYTYDKNKLIFDRIENKKIFSWGVLLILILGLGIGYILSSVGPHPNPIEKMVYKERLILLPEVPQVMNDTILSDMLKKYNFKFPHIVMAQALHESKRFTSEIFFENNNLFGMKEAGSRGSTATGTNRKHATYDSYEMSVLDYLLYQTAYLRTIKTETAYLEYLNKYYASDTIYDKNIKRYLDETKPYFKKK